MSNANKKALDWLPKRKDGRKRYYSCDDDDIRHIYAKGYRKAEKDLGLSWEDMFDVFRLVNEVLDDDYIEGKTKKEVGEEVLKRFKERKEK